MTRVSSAIYLCLAVGLMLVTLPRFDRHDPVWLEKYTNIDAFGRKIAGELGDSAAYVAYVRWFRDEGPDWSVPAPFAYRPLAPFLAAQLPLDPMSSLNVVNLASLFVGLWFILKTLRRLSLGPAWQAMGGGLFVFSFPTFYYATVGYVDPVLVCFVAVAAYVMLVGRWWAFAACLALGLLANEKSLIVLPPAIMCIRSSKMSGRAKVAAVMALVTIAGCSLALARATGPSGPGYAWTPSLEVAKANLVRPRAWLAMGLSLGLPTLLLGVALARDRGTPRSCGRGERAALLVGYLSALAVGGYSVFGAYVDGRYGWATYPFAIPVAMALWHDRRNSSVG